MSKTIEEQVTADVVETLRTVRRRNGYHFDLVIEQTDADYNIPRDLLAVLHAGDGEDEEGPSLGHVGWFKRYTAEVTLYPPNNATTPIDAMLGLAAADIHKAMMLDYTRGGLAYDTQIVQPEKFPDGSPPTVLVNFIVHYRHLDGDPFNQ